MIALYVACAALLGVIGVMTYHINLLQRRHNDALETWSMQRIAQEAEWASERKSLLDRIQAPSYAEYKSGEIRMAKVQKDDKPEQPIELL